MSSKRRRARREKFFAEHPKCCFCGGGSGACEEDHVPGRVFFSGRQWPEGYVFPACVECNRATADDEQVLAFFALMGVELSEHEFLDFSRLFHAIRAIHPQIIDAFRIPQSSNEVRRILRKLGYSKPTDTLTADIPVVSLGPEISKSVLSYGRKLMLALWYKHVGSVLPQAGGVRLKWFSNTTSDAQAEALNSTLELMPTLGELKRSARMLDDQFSYRYGVTSDGKAAAFFLTFRGTFAILGVVSAEKSAFAGLEGDVLGPFRWESA